MSKAIANQVLSHADCSEIITKLVSEISPEDIADWLKAKYSGQKQLIISKKNLQIFRDEYLDIYSTIREDLVKTHFNIRTVDEDLQEEIQGNVAYKKKLEEMVDKEIDIKNIVRNLVIKIEFRANEIFELAINDPRNLKNEKIIIEWFQLLLNTLEKFDLITNGSPEQVTVQNNISIQMVDTHINMLYSVIREILSQLDNETSLIFTELFAKKLAEIQSADQNFVPIERRLEAAYTMEKEVEKKLDL
jgi:hypothetical protein